MPRFRIRPDSEPGGGAYRRAARGLPGRRAVRTTSTGTTRPSRWRSTAKLVVGVGEARAPALRLPARRQRDLPPQRVSGSLPALDRWLPRRWQARATDRTRAQPQGAARCLATRVIRPDLILTERRLRDHGIGQPTGRYWPHRVAQRDLRWTLGRVAGDRRGRGDVRRFPGRAAGRTRARTSSCRRSRLITDRRWTGWRSACASAARDWKTECAEDYTAGRSRCLPLLRAVRSGKRAAGGGDHRRCGERRLRGVAAPYKAFLEEKLWAGLVLDGAAT